MAARLWTAGLLMVWMLAPASATAQSTQAEVLADEEVAEVVRQTFSPDADVRNYFLKALEMRGLPDVVPGLIQVMRFTRDDGEIDQTIASLTGEEPGKGWPEWMLWQQAHPEIEPFEGFDTFKADTMAVIDPNFRLFLQPGVAHDIRLEEIVWGGVLKDGIPALVNPKHLSPDEATYLQDDELVFGVEINGDARAYPLRVLDWHEMFNDVVGGVPVALAYCTLCGSGILYDMRVSDRDEPFEFGSSGFLYRSNKLMYDQQTHSLWNQFTGKPVVGPLTGSGIELDTLPVTITTWRDWREQQPQTKVLSLDTGHERDYTPGRPYGEYFASAELMFPVLVEDTRLAPKDYVFALRGATPKAWSLADFEGGRVIQDDDLGVVLVGDAASRTVRAYETGGRDFEAGADLSMLRADGQDWLVEEAGLTGPAGEQLKRLPGHIAYWFAWQNFIDGARLAEQQG
ncbi:MAG: DUF3179 domain-containing protein [Pseudomonadota bacterium]